MGTDPHPLLAGIEVSNPLSYGRGTIQIFFYFSSLKKKKKNQLIFSLFPILPLPESNERPYETDEAWVGVGIANELSPHHN